jgi:hypothetical protein
MTRARSIVVTLGLILGLASLVGAPTDAAHAATTYSMGGRFVDLSTGRPVGGVRITIRDGSDVGIVLRSATTGPRGYFRATGIPAADGYGVYANGRRVGYRSGYVTYYHRLGTWGDAYAWDAGSVGTVKIRRR